jgi:hypothetical protein
MKLRAGPAVKTEQRGGKMKPQVKLALITGVLALTLGPSALAAGKPDGVPPYGKGAANGKGPTYTPAPPTLPGPKDGLPAQAKAYGRYCQGESRKHVKGEKGTAFSRCVTGVAQLREDEAEAGS